MRYTIKDILKMEVAPALGCTEPAAVGLCAASAMSLLKNKQMKSLELWVDSNIYKNGMAVSIPGTMERCGIDLAAVLGAIGGDPALRLEVLDPIDQEILEKALDFLEKNRVKINLLRDKKPIYIRAKITNDSETAEAVIKGLHDNLVSLKYNGVEVEEHRFLSETQRSKSKIDHLEKWLVRCTLEELVALVEEVDEEDLDFLQKGVQYNMKLAAYGLSHGPGLGVGLTLDRLVKEGLLKKDMALSAKILASSAADARMSGVKLPAMSSSGSGNIGLTAVLPIWAVKDYIHCEDHEKVLKAIGLSHVITAYIKAFTGRLSAVCGCSIAAGAGAAAGITYLMSGNRKHIAGAIKNLLEDLAGIICDGAKASCALKLATAAGTAVQAALFSLHGLVTQETDGIIAKTPEKTMENVGRLSTQGMIETDKTILDILISKYLET